VSSDSSRITARSIPAPAAPAPTHRADGTPVQARAPRYRVSLPAVVSGPNGNDFMLTCSVSVGGCALAWNGPAPRLGGGLHLKIGTGPRAVPVRAAVCWAREAPRGLRVGVRFLVTGNASTQTALAALVAEARRTGQVE